jgi:hypothetical protein
VVQVLTAYTLKADDVEAAVLDILSQLEPEKKLLKNTAGFLFCYYDFIETGVVKAICERLPFEVLGCTTQGIALPQAAGDIILALMVLTSDDLEFKIRVSQSLETDGEKRIEEFYREMRSSLEVSPPLTFAFLPRSPSFTGDQMFEILNRQSGGAFLYGSCAFDLDHNSPMIIHNGEAYPDRMCLMMVVGPTEPRFFIDSVIKQEIFYQRAHITSAKGNRLLTVNDMPAVEYMTKIGIIKDGFVGALLAFPILADLNDGSEPRLLIFTGIGPDGSLVCVSNVPNDASLSIGFPTTDLVLKTAEDVAGLVKAEQSRQARTDGGALFFSCVSRNLTLIDTASEMEKIRESMADSSQPYIFIYSGGEICPWKNDEISFVNGFHVYALIACTF